MFQLDLKTFFYPEINVKANQDHMLKAKEGPVKEPETEVSMRYYLNEERKSIVGSVEVYTVDTDDDDPYEFRIEVVGMFLVSRFDEEEMQFGEEFELREKSLVRNAVTILIGSVRDTLHTVTCKGPFGPVVLPTLYLAESDMPERSE